MDCQLVTSSPKRLHPKRQRYPIPRTNPSWILPKTTRNSLEFRNTTYQHKHYHRQQKKKPLLTKASAEEQKNRTREVVSSREENAALELVVEERGSVVGAVALIIGTSIGSGILALPQKALPAGLFPSSVSLIVCWAFLLIEALVLVEINVALRGRRRGSKEGETSELDVISIRTMAQETLGDFGGASVAMTYVFFSYASIVAYTSKSGDILLRLVDLPAPISGLTFTSIFAMLFSFGGSRKIDQVNQILTAAMIGLLVAIEVLGIVFGGWSGLERTGGDWGKVPPSLPVIIFSLVYHDIVPVICAYLGSDLKRIRISVFLGSLVPLVSLLVWDAIAFGLSSNANQVYDPVESLLSVEWSGVSYMVEAFSILAIGTSLIGTLLAFTEFLKEQLASKKTARDSIAIINKEINKDLVFEMREWRTKHELGLIATVVAVAPSLLVSSIVPDAFSAATDFAGGYCMTMLYGVLPPAMAWAMYSRQREDSEPDTFPNARQVVLIAVGLFACAIVTVQILLDILILQP